MLLDPQGFGEIPHFIAEQISRGVDTGSKQQSRSLNPNHQVPNSVPEFLSSIVLLNNLDMGRACSTENMLFREVKTALEKMLTKCLLSEEPENPEMLNGLVHSSRMFLKRFNFKEEYSTKNLADHLHS